MTTLGTILEDKADKTALDLKVDKSSVDTALNENSNNPIANKAVATRLKEIYTKKEVEDIVDSSISDSSNAINALKSNLEEKINSKADKFTIDTELKNASVVDKHVIEAPEVKEYTNIIIIGKGLKANGDTQIQCGVSYAGNNYAMINGIDATFSGDTSINYFAELEVIPGVGVKATIRSGTKPLLECEQCYSTFIDFDIEGIKYVLIKTRTSGVAFTSGKVTVYGR